MMKYFWLVALSCLTAFAADQTATVNRDHVNVRGGPAVTSEVVTRLKKGDAVTVIEDIAVEKPKPGDPAKWAKIKLPTNTSVWVFNDFLDGDKVKVKKLNLRAGPGENFSVLGALAKGDAIKEIRKAEGWTQIETPDTTYAFVDASYLDREVKVAAEPLKVYEPPAKPVENPVANKPEPAAVEAPKPEPAKTEPPKVETKVVKEEPKPEPVVVKEEPKPAPAKVDVQPTKETPAPKEEPKVEAPKPISTPAKPEENTPQPATSPAPRVLPQVAPPVETIVETNTAAIKRVVRREGELRPTKFSIQAPSYFELRTSKGKVINYLTAEKSGVKLKDYKGLRVIVTGEEYQESRYPLIPMLEVETIEVAP